MQIIELSAEAHDRRVCDVSHLPHLIAAALVTMQERDSLDLVGSGFLDTTRVAGGDGALWRDILQDNRDALLDSLERFAQTLHNASKLLDSQKSTELQQWLDAAASRRNRLIPRKSTESAGN